MATPETRRQLLAAVAACEDKKGEDTRILELDPADSGLADFFLITSATNDRQVVAIADEIEMRLKKEFGLYPTSVEGRRQAEWILLDYVDIVIHVFLAEKRAFYDIERLRKSARPLTSVELEAELKSELAQKTLAVRGASSKAPRKAAKVTTSKSPATKASKPRPTSAKSSPKGDSIVSAKPAKKAAKKAALKKAAPKSNARPKAKAKPSIKKAATKVASKPAKKAAKKVALKSASKVAAGKVGAMAPPVTSKQFEGARPPILKCEDPDTKDLAGTKGHIDGVLAPPQGAQPPIVKCEDPDEPKSAVKTAAKAAPKKAKK
jgi:ribosome-associated protein